MTNKVAFSLEMMAQILLFISGNREMIPHENFSDPLRYKMLLKMLILLLWFFLYLHALRPDSHRLPQSGGVEMNQSVSINWPVNQRNHFLKAQKVLTVYYLSLVKIKTNSRLL